MKKVEIIEDFPSVPWFPRKLSDLDTTGKTTTLEAGQGMAYIEHPGNDDPEYKQRRYEIGEIAMDYKMSDKEVPRIPYTEVEQ